MTPHYADAPNHCLAVLMEPGVDGAHLCPLPIGHDDDHHCDACEMTWVNRTGVCESCGEVAEIIVDDGSFWCRSCDNAARSLGYDQ